MAVWDRWLRRSSREPPEAPAGAPQAQPVSPETFAAVSRTVRDMLRSGRLSSDNMGWSWNPFAFIGRRNQKAHQLDFTKLKTLSASELLEILVSTHPDVSDAVWQFLRIADTNWSFTVRRPSGKEDSAGQRALHEAVSGLEAAGLTPGFELSKGLGSSVHQNHLMVLVRGAFCVEVEPTADLRGVRAIHVVDPATIEFRFDPDGRPIPWQRVDFLPPVIPPEQRALWQGNYKRLDSPTIIWEALDSFPGDPHGREPLLPVLQVVFFEIQVLHDLQAVVHNQGYPRLEVKIVEEVMIKRALQYMPQLASDPDQLTKFLEGQIDVIKQTFAALEPDDTIVHPDSAEVKAVGVEGKGPMVDVKKLIEIIEARIATGCKTFLTMLSRHTGTAEGSRKTDTQVYLKSVAGIQKVAARGWSRALAVALNLLGRQGTVEFIYESPDLRAPDEQERDFAARMGNARRLFDDGLLDEGGYYQYIFDRAADPATLERMRERYQARASPPPPRGGGGNT